MRKRVSVFNTNMADFIISVNEFKNKYVDTPYLMMNSNTAMIINAKSKTPIIENDINNFDGGIIGHYDGCKIYIDNNLADGVIQLC